MPSLVYQAINNENCNSLEFLVKIVSSLVYQAKNNELCTSFEFDDSKLFLSWFMKPKGQTLHILRVP